MDERQLKLSASKPGQDIRAALAAYLGRDDPELLRLAQELVKREHGFIDWLAEDPANTERLVREPLAVIRERFPHLHLPEPTGEFRLPPGYIVVVAGRGIDEQAENLFNRLRRYAAESEANAAQVRANPVNVAARLAAGEHVAPAAVAQVAQAIEVVLGSRVMGPSRITPPDRSASP